MPDDSPVKHGHVAQVKEWPYSSFHQMVKRQIYSDDTIEFSDGIQALDFRQVSGL